MDEEDVLCVDLSNNSEMKKFFQPPRRIYLRLWQKERVVKVGCHLGPRGHVRAQNMLRNLVRRHRWLEVGRFIGELSLLRI